MSQGQLGRSYWGQLAGVECSRKGCRHEGQSPGQAWALAGSSVHPLMAQVPATRWCRMESLQSEDRPGRSEPVLVPGAQGEPQGSPGSHPQVARVVVDRLTQEGGGARGPPSTTGRRQYGLCSEGV